MCAGGEGLPVRLDRSLAARGFLVHGPPRRAALEGAGSKDAVSTGDSANSRTDRGPGDPRRQSLCPAVVGGKIGAGDRLARRTSIACNAAANREYTRPWLDPRSRATGVPPARGVPHRVRPSAPRLRGGWHATRRDASGATSPSARGRRGRASDCSPERPGRHESEPPSTARLAARRTLVHCSTRSGQVDRRRGRSDEVRTPALECEPGEGQRGRRIPHHRPQVPAWQPVGRVQEHTSQFDRP